MDDRFSSRQMMGTFIFLLTGPILWAGQLTAIYGAQSSLCATGALEPSLIGGIVLAISLLTIILSVLTLLWPKPVFVALTGTTPPEEQRDFILGVMRTLGGLATLGMGYLALAAVLLPACGQLR